MIEDVETNLVATQKIVVAQKNQQNGTVSETTHTAPADGGSRAWVVMLGSFFCNGILFGVINSYGVLYTEFHDNFQRRNVSNPSGKAGNKATASPINIRSFSEIISTTFRFAPHNNEQNPNSRFVYALAESSGLAFWFSNRMACLSVNCIMYALLKILKLKVDG
ncbi:hypothetical protein JTB14_020969 [Gonioctena quinquepunctata]|nr:hypothetical protein JTB14_020969 [Gonioctena quinquepunctata]